MCFGLLTRKLMLRRVDAINFIKLMVERKWFLSLVLVMRHMGMFNILISLAILVKKCFSLEITEF